MWKQLATALSLIAASGCTTQICLQAGSDTFTTPIPNGKSIVIIEAAAKESTKKRQGDEGRMLVGFLRVIPGKTQLELYENPYWDFATYPGAIIPGYAGKPFHGMHAYLLEPGTYAVIRCSYLLPEYDYCRDGVWLRDDKPAGMAFFEVGEGQVINTGKLLVSMTTSLSQGRVYRVSLLNNHEAATKYVSEQWPELLSRLEYRPMKFQY